jgi:hypothetical protein
MRGGHHDHSLNLSCIPLGSSSGPLMMTLAFAGVIAEDRAVCIACGDARPSLPIEAAHG